MKTKFWISYFIVLFFNAWLIAYLIAIQSKDIGVGILYCLFCYFLFAISATYHGHKIAKIGIGYSLLLAIASASIGGIFTFVMSEIVLSRSTVKMITPTNFMEWLVSFSIVGLFCALGILLVSWIKQRKVQASDE